MRTLNERLKAREAQLTFPQSYLSAWLPPASGKPIYQQRFLALEGDVVRGGYILKTQDFHVRGRVFSISDYQLPISEGLVDSAYNLLGIRLLTNALARQPHLFALGMGGYKKALPRMLVTMGWHVQLIPFYFRVLKASVFFQNINVLSRRGGMRFLLEVARMSGLGSSALRALQFRLPTRINSELSCEEVGGFGQWVDRIWEDGKADYEMVAVRSQSIVDILYPSTNTRFHRLKILDGQKPVGWAVVLDTKMTNHKQFGNMRVGSLVDGFCRAADAPLVVSMAASYLENRGVDMIVSNQCYKSWCAGLRRAGFIRGPSNFVLAISQQLASKLDPMDELKDRMHWTRGDGDGPINL